MDSRNDQPTLATDHDYEPTTVIEVGSVVELTHGSRYLDTADMKQWYN